MSAKKAAGKLDDAAREANDALKATAPELEGSAIEVVDGDTKDASEAPLADKIIDETAEEEKLAEAKPDTDEDIKDDPVLAKAVEEIEKEDSDALLKAEDEERELDAAMSEAETKGFKTWLRNVWNNQRWRWTIIASVIFLVLAAILVPNSRYFILNNVGVRSSLSIKIIDGGTLQPLKNVKVQAGGSSGQTGSDGVVKLEKVRLGRTKLQIDKRAFAMVERNITVGWGSNPLGEQKIQAVGAQYTFLVKDFLSGKPIAGAEAASGEGNASSDSEGKLVLTLDTAEAEDSAEVSVDISAANYRAETMTFTVSNRETQEVALVPARKHVFVSKRSGKYDVYSAHVDGKNETKLVSGTGLEGDDISLVPHQKNSLAAFVATRENVRNPAGYLLATLYILNTESGELVKLDQSEQIQVIGWSDEGRLVYVKIAAGASGTDPKRHRLMSFNSSDYTDIKELASSNSFNDVTLAGNKVYVAPSNIFNENSSPGVFVVDPSGDNQRQILDREAYGIVRSAYDTLNLSSANAWFAYTLGSVDSAKPSAAPGSQTSRVYIDNPSNDFSLWSDNRDGKGVLLINDSNTKSDTVLSARGGLRGPYYWLNDKYAVFRVNDGKETADYVLNTEGGEARKIADVTDTRGIGRWFYY